MQDFNTQSIKIGLSQLVTTPEGNNNRDRR